MTQRNPGEGNEGRGNGNGRGGRDRNLESEPSYARGSSPRESDPASRGGMGGRSHSHVHDEPFSQPPGQRTGSRHWMRDPEPPRMDFRAGESHAGYGDYGTREYEPRPEGDFASGGRWGGGEPPSATRPRDFRDYGRGDYRGNVGPGGFGYAEANYGPTRYREAYGRTGRDPGPGQETGGWRLDEQGWRDEQQRSHRGRGPRNYRRSDERIRETLCERLTDDPYVDASDVSVEVKDGVVTLTGSVTERRMKHRIEDIASDVARDNEIRNEIRVKG